jgi:SpoVK/Ycf46/Vps4 family AAA+-type ATPase
MTPRPKTPPQAPEWFEVLRDKFRRHHAFILHFNVRDYVVGTATLPEYLAAAMTSRDVVVFYDIAKGLTFPNDAQRAAFIRLLGLDAPKAAPANPLMAALGQPVAASADPLADFKAPAAALPLLEDLLLKKDVSSAVMIFDAEMIVPAGDVAAMNPADRQNLVRVRNWTADKEMEMIGNAVFLVTTDVGGLHETVRSAASRFEQIAIPYPDLDARRAFVEGIDWNGTQLEIDLDAFARLTAALNLVQIEDIAIKAVHSGTLKREIVLQRKAELVAAEYGENVEFVDPAFGWEGIGELEHVKRFLSRNITQPMRMGRWQRVPMGVLLTGAPGTGKSAVAQALAREAGVMMIKLNFGGQIASKWQGEGERNLRRVFTAIKTFAPVIVFIDEIDQVIRRGGDGAGNQQENRLFQMTLEFMSETSHRGQIVFLAATNRPDLLDAALKRPGRFDKKIPFFVPVAEERASIFKVMARRYMGIDLAAPDDEFAVACTEGWTGAEIEAAIVKAVEILEDADMEGRPIEPEEAIDQAVLKIRPSTFDVQLQTQKALEEVNDEDLLPDWMREQWVAARETQAQQPAARVTQPRGAREL